MQARSNFYKVFVVALIASLILGACGGGTSGSTWFNLPSIGLNVQEDGSVSTFGFNLGPVLPPTLVPQLRAANIQKLEVRAGYNGVHVYANGVDLPYLTWDAESVDTLQAVLRNSPNIPNGNLIANLLPWLRTIGVGAAVNLPGGGDVGPRWQGETAVTPETVDNPIGPFAVRSVALDQTGNLSIGSVPASALGINGPIVDAATLDMLESFGIDQLQIRTTPNGIQLALNDQPLPGIAYDSASLAAVQPLITAFAPELAPTLESALPLLQRADVDVAVSLTGEPAGETALAPVPVVLKPDGTVAAFGFDLPGGPIVPADVVQKLQAAGVETLQLDIGQEGLFISANGQTLPTITWTPESLNTLAGAVAPIAGLSPDTINGALQIINETGGIKANIAYGDAAAPEGEINKTLSPPASAEGGPVIRLNATVENGVITSIEGVGNLADLGMDPIALPPNVMQILGQLNANQVEIKTGLGTVDIILDGNTALTLNWDEPSIQAALTLAGPFLAGTPLEDPNVAQLVQEQIVPLLPIADVDVKLSLN